MYSIIRGVSRGISSGSMLGIRFSIAFGIRSGSCSLMWSGMGTFLSTALSMSGMTLGMTIGINIGIMIGIMGFINASMPGTYLTIFIMVGRGAGIAAIIWGISSTIRSVIFSGCIREIILSKGTHDSRRRWSSPECRNRGFLPPSLPGPGP